MILQGNCLEKMAELEDNSIDTIITDPPYGLSFMGKKWDYDVPSVEVWKECLRVLKPGGTALIFAGSRTQHRMAVNVEDAGFELKDCIMWLYGQGFPKATDISKQLDKGVERRVIGKRSDGVGNTDDSIHKESGLASSRSKEYNITEPATEEAKLWNGWKSHGLKPAYEPVLWATKPLTNSNDYDIIIVELNNYIELLLWLSLAKLEKMDMSKLQEMESTLLSIASLWNNILNANLTKESKFTILTETGLITELRTLKYLILENTQVKDIVERLKALGSSLSALIVAKSMKNEKKKTKDILNVIVQENAISTLKENGIFAELVKTNSLLPILNNLNSVLKNAITKIEKTPSPNYEPILVAMKPNDGTYANNALKWGVSGLNIDGGRIGTDEITVNRHSGYNSNSLVESTKGKWKGESEKITGRFPANILLDEEAAKMLDEQTDGKTTQGHWSKTTTKGFGEFGGGESTYEGVGKKAKDTGGASRFFYVAKASKSERNAGCEYIERGCSHPTVKPLKLMEYLCTLTKTPTGGVVLDPFAGSGTTGLACINTGRDYILIEREEEYIPIIEARLKSVEQKLL